MLSDSGERDTAGFQVQEEQNVISCQPVPREHLDTVKKSIAAKAAM
jgi:hypothetical protein